MGNKPLNFSPCFFLEEISNAPRQEFLIAIDHHAGAAIVTHNCMGDAAPRLPNDQMIDTANGNFDPLTYLWFVRNQVKLGIQPTPVALDKISDFVFGYVGRDRDLEAASTGLYPERQSFGAGVLCDDQRQRAPGDPNAALVAALPFGGLGVEQSKFHDLLVADSRRSAESKTPSPSLVLALKTRNRDDHHFDHLVHLDENQSSSAMRGTDFPFFLEGLDAFFSAF